jgi:hypothetical protein
MGRHTSAEASAWRRRSRRTWYDPAVAISLSVNLNKIALLRNSRGGGNPSPKIAGQHCLDAGAYGLTLHWRHDNRHTRAEDVRVLRALCEQRGAEFNLEGDDREELIALAIELGSRSSRSCRSSRARSPAITGGTCRPSTR